MRRVTRISDTPAGSIRIGFNEAGVVKEWDRACEGGSPQVVEEGIADVIRTDRSLAPHFRIEPVGVPGDVPASAPAQNERAG